MAEKESGDLEAEEVEEVAQIDRSTPVMVEIERNNFLGNPIRDRVNLWDLTKDNGLKPFLNYRRGKTGYYLQEDLITDRTLSDVLSRLS